MAQIFGERDAIADSDQGKSFRAFWDFLMSPDRQEELTGLLEKVFAMESIATLHADTRLKQIHYDWLEAGEHTQRTVAKLSQQLRRYLDNQAYLENKRIMQLLQTIEINALAVRQAMPPGPGWKSSTARAIYYWSDIDTHGFAMLDQIRAYFPQTISFLMDRNTTLQNRAQWGHEKIQITRDLPRLNAAETLLYNDLRNNQLTESLRLEQEKIPYAVLQTALQGLVGNSYEWDRNQSTY